MEAVWVHAREAAPRECVGLLVGRDGRAWSALRLPNASRTPCKAYEAEPATLVRALYHIEQDGDEVVALYHSHPTGTARPSATDKVRAYWRLPYLIVGLADGYARAFILPQGEEMLFDVEP